MLWIYFNFCSTMVNKQNWIVLAVRKHIVPQKSLAGAGVAVGVEEAAQGGVVVAGLQVIEARLGNAVLSSVAKEVDFDSRGNRDLSQELI